MQRIAYYAPLFLAALVALLPVSLTHAQITLDTPAWRVEAADVNWLTQNNTDRGGAYDPTTDHVLVVGRMGGSPAVYVVNAEDGSLLGTLSRTGISGGAPALEQIAVTSDGKIFAANKVTDSSAENVKIYYWEDETSQPVLVYNGNPNPDDPDADDRRFGEGFGVSGTAADNDIQVYLSSLRNTNLAVFDWDGNDLGDPRLITVVGGRAGDGIAKAPGEEALWINGLDKPITKISSTDGSVLATISEDLIDNNYDALALTEINGRVLLAAGPANTSGGTSNDQFFTVLDVTDASNPLVLYNTESLGESNPTGNGFVAFDTQRNNLIALSTNNAIASYPLNLDLDTYIATLAGYNEVGPVMTEASGEATATMDGTTLTVTGSFDGLSSKLRNVAGTPAHIHVGAAGTNGPVVVKLSVSTDADSLAGAFEEDANTFDLSTLSYPDGIDADSVMSALANGNAYVNVHTQNFPGGEVRGQLLTTPNRMPNQASILSPDDGTTVSIEGANSQTFAVDWEDAGDPDNDRVVYVWQLATDADFSNILFQTNTGTESGVSTRYRVVDSLLVLGNVAMGESITLYHRANSQDGSLRTEGAASSVTLARSSTPLPAEGETGLPERFTLDGNYPNPFNPSTSIRFDLPGAASVSLKVYDVMGREVMALPAQAFGAGARQELRMDAASLSSGTYFYRVIAQMGTETEIQTGTMVLIK